MRVILYKEGTIYKPIVKLFSKKVVPVYVPLGPAQKCLHMSLAVMEVCWVILKGNLNDRHFSAQTVGSIWLGLDLQPCPGLAWWSSVGHTVCPNILTSKRNTCLSGCCKSLVSAPVWGLSLTLLIAFVGLSGKMEVCNRELMNKRTEKNRCRFDRCKSSQFDLCLSCILAAV